MSERWGDSRRDRESLDRHITGNYGEGQFDDDPEICGRLMVGSGTDTYDPICELPPGHPGACKSSAAIDQHRLQ